MFGDKTFPGVGYPTPVDIPETTSCLTLQIPKSSDWWAITVGLLYCLTLEWNWQQFEGGIARDVAAERFTQMFDDALALAETTETCPIYDIPTPYWDEDSEVDDSASQTTQVWYGEVDDPTVAPTELTFRENAEIWTWAGLLAIAGAPGAALSFLTIAPKFVLAFKQGDIGKVIRVFVDADEAGSITDSGDGSVVEMPINADPTLDTHQIYITVGEA